MITRKEKSISVKKKRLRELREKNHSDVHEDEDDKETVVDEINKIEVKIQQEAAELDFINGKIRLENCILKKRVHLNELNQRQQGKNKEEIKKIHSSSISKNKVLSECQRLWLNVHIAVMLVITNLSKFKVINFSFFYQ